MPLAVPILCGLPVHTSVERDAAHGFVAAVLGEGALVNRGEVQLQQMLLCPHPDANCANLRVIVINDLELDVILVMAATGGAEERNLEEHVPLRKVLHWSWSRRWCRRCFLPTDLEIRQASSAWVLRLCTQVAPSSVAIVGVEVIPSALRKSIAHGLILRLGNVAVLGADSLAARQRGPETALARVRGGRRGLLDLLIDAVRAEIQSERLLEAVVEHFRVEIDLLHVIGRSQSDLEFHRIFLTLFDSQHKLHRIRASFDIHNPVRV
mmetsp:Transcript_106793/g.267705  ORF Transcript_106793/g.267705 Transcript_106793/m.267705 type:complete len:266 (-) Transcript_106793:1080-1877(-)